jgi:hypothetical protein
LGLAIIATGCGGGSYDISNSTDRAAMEDQINIDLTNNNCTDALTLSTELYQSAYSDNTVRMLYASAQACNVGIQLFDLLNDITNASFSAPDSIFRVLVKLFPSSSADSRMQSSWFAQDALQAILNPGSVIAPSDEINFTSDNPASDLASDHTLDANSYMIFIAMSVLGTTLNRTSYTTETPASLSYSPQQLLPWTSKAAVQADTSGAACAIASGFYNLYDGITQTVGDLSGSTASQLTAIQGYLNAGIALAGTFNCEADSYSASLCAAAAQRIRYRGACAETPQAASFAAGIIQGINVVWHP